MAAQTQQETQQTQELHDWQLVTMRQYRQLGNRIASLEALERGEQRAAPDLPPTPGAQPLTIGEQLATVKAQVMMVLRSLQGSLQAVLDTRPQVGDDCELVQVRRVCGLEWEAEESAGAAVDEGKARLN